MKLISLNIWGGRVHDPFIKFIQEHAEDTDVFCFQEVYRTSTDIKIIDNAHANIYGEIAQALPEHIGYFASAENNYTESGPTDFDLQFGQAIFIKKSLKHKSGEHVFVHKHLGAERSENGYSGARLLVYTTVQNNNVEFTIANFHGLHDGLGKGDSEERFVQSQKIKEFLNQISGPKILCGDFNLLPDTKSLEMLEGGMRNLIKENNITSTRSSFYKKESKFADYMLVSPEIKVLDFKVLQAEVSDHLPLLLEFN